MRLCAKDLKPGDRIGMHYDMTVVGIPHDKPNPFSGVIYVTVRMAFGKKIRIEHIPFVPGHIVQVSRDFNTES